MSTTLFSAVGKALGIAPGYWPKGFTGAKVAPLTVGLASAGIGKLVGMLMAGALRKEERKRLSNRLALLAGLGGAGTAFGLITAPTAQLIGGDAGFAEGLKKLYSITGKYKEAPYGESHLAGSGYTSDELNWNELGSQMNQEVKSGSFLGSFNKPNIGVSSSLNLIQSDPFLNPIQKAQAISLVQKANNNKLQGIISLGQLAGAAVDIGVGAAAGSALGGILGLPPRVRRRFSQGGGLASFLASRGLVSL